MLRRLEVKREVLLASGPSLGLLHNYPISFSLVSRLGRLLLSSLD